MRRFATAVTAALLLVGRASARASASCTTRASASSPARRQGPGHDARDPVRDRSHPVRCPTASTWAKASASPRTPRARVHLHAQRRVARVRVRPERANSSRSSARTATATASPTPSTSTGTTTSGRSTRASNLIIKYAPDGKLLMVIGKRPDPHRPAQQDARAWRRGRAPTGRTRSTGPPTSGGTRDNIYVSDGYTDARIVKYDKNGRFIKSAGRAATRRTPGVRRAPHHGRGRQRQRVRRRPRQLADRGAGQGPEPEGGVRQRGRAVGNLRLPETGRAVPLHVQLGGHHHRRPLPAPPPARSTR